MRYIADHIDGARLHIFPGCGHTNLVEEPEISAKVVIDFLNSVA
jgi:pimeloyl-ACP methyl ester carboxylesterase